MNRTVDDDDDDDGINRSFSSSSHSFGSPQSFSCSFFIIITHLSRGSHGIIPQCV